MQKDIEIGEQTVAMRANAATAYRYRQVFKGDLLTELVARQNNQTDPEYIELIQRLGYIMAAAAAGKDMNTLSEVSYVDWLEGFDAIELMEALPKIMEVYVGNKVTKSTPKKKDVKQSDK